MNLFKYFWETFIWFKLKLCSSSKRCTKLWICCSRFSHWMIRAQILTAVGLGWGVWLRPLLLKLNSDLKVLSHFIIIYQNFLVSDRNITQNHGLLSSEYQRRQLRTVTRWLLCHVSMSVCLWRRLARVSISRVDRGCRRSSVQWGLLCVSSASKTWTPCQQ